MSHSSRLTKVLYPVLGAALFISIWISVSLFYSDHVARKRDEVLATRIMVRVDQLMADWPPGRPIPFVVMGAHTPDDDGPLRKVQVFGHSFFGYEHEGGNPWRVAGYLRILGINTLEPHLLTEAAQSRSVIEAMPEWPAAGSIANVNGMLVIKLGPMPGP
jgi:hypothetical protein